MNTRLADLRSPITLDQAKDIARHIAELECHLATQDALLEQSITALKSQHHLSTEDSSATLQAQREALGGFINANPHLFQRPKTIATSHATFGLRTVTDLHIADPDALIQHCLQSGYDDCLIVKHTPNKAGIKARLETGEPLPSCTIRTGQTAVIKVHKALIDQARAASAAKPAQE